MIKFFNILTIGLAMLILTCCSSSDKVIDNFESGTFDKWTVEGEAFGSKPDEMPQPGQQEISGYEGKAFANSFHEGDDSRGTLVSSPFKIERNYINFLIGGGTGPDVYMALEVDGQTVLISRPIVESEALHQLTWNVKNYKGKMAVIKIVDNQRGEWGHILVDQIVMSNKEKSDIMVGYEQSYKIDKKYLLVPIEDKSPITKLSIQQNGEYIYPSLDIRLAQTKTDYWIPIDVEQYKGQELNLIFDHVKKTDIGFSQITQSDSFNFDYNEKFRPDYHFSPYYGWTNDPNGMVFNNGEYHLYYQSNPYGSMWGNLHWGHAVTKDFRKWEHLPFAIEPDSLGAIFSGSAVIDKNNTAGFGKNALVAIYTSAGQIQAQSIAYSLDNGRTFVKYKNNPVLTDARYVDFRDPKVFWHNRSNQWIMSLATTQTITFYASKNLKEWIRLSEFGDGIGDHGGVWECPDLFPLTFNGQTKWVLFVSINPGGPNGGSATQYFIGSFDGKTFKPDDLPYPLWLDYGCDNYAGVTWNNAPDGRRIFIGWMSNWNYTNQVPTTHFRNAMTLPRDIKLLNNGDHLIVASYPVKEINGLRAETQNLGNIEVKTTNTVEKLLDNNTGAFEIEMTINNSNVNNFGFRLSNSKGESLDFFFDIEKRQFIVNRSKSGLVGFSKNFASSSIISPLVVKDSYKIRLLMDKASSEIFINDGELVQTNTIFPTEPYNRLDFRCNGGNIIIDDFKIYKLQQ